MMSEFNFSIYTHALGLAGPRILPDRPYAPRSLAHYRYGAFGEQRQLSHDDRYSWVIFDPDRNPVEDRRSGTSQPRGDGVAEGADGQPCFRSCAADRTLESWALTSAQAHGQTGPDLALDWGTHALPVRLET